MKTLTLKRTPLNKKICTWILVFFSFLPMIDAFAVHPVPPALSDEKFQRLYKMMHIVSDLFQKNEIEYFAEGKTLLGAVRHEGLIPWDPSLDIVVSMNDYMMIVGLAEELATHNLNVVKHPRYQYRLSIQDSSLDLSVDVHFYWVSKDLLGRRKVFLAEHRFQYMNADYFFFEEVAPLQTQKFGNSTIPIPNQSETYLTRRYGKDWRKTAHTETKFNGHTYTFEIQDFSPYPDNNS
jgi:lipopolysaccharide cholinephosphotransferase